MRIRLTSLPLLCALLFSGWPTALMAYVPEQPLQILPGQNFMLVASRKLTGPWFRETVILVTRHSHSSPIGIILNRPRNVTLDKVFPAHPEASGIKLFAGGPVNRRYVSYLFRGDEAVAGAIKISGHVYLSYDMPMLDKLLSGTQAHTGLRVANGLASWAPGQLENEIARGDWYILPVDEAVIFDLPVAGMWTELIRRATIPFP